MVIYYSYGVAEKRQPLFLLVPQLWSTNNPQELVLIGQGRIQTYGKNMTWK